MYHFCSENRLSKILFSNPSQKKRSADCESQKSGFGFDPKNPPRMWILWIHDSFLNLPKKRKIHFWIRKSGFRFSQKNTLKVNQTAQWPLTKKANSSSDKSNDSPDIATTLYSLPLLVLHFMCYYFILSSSLGFAFYVKKRAIELCQSLTSQWKQTFYARSR